MSIEVVRPGMFSSFQDLGRVGHQHLGVPVGGAMDELSHRLANLALGNDEHEATLEITLMGPVLRFDRAATIAWAGADLSPTLDGRAVPSHQPVAVAAGATLQFGARRFGVRAYLALRGGFALPQVLGSASTYGRGGFGGHQGRALRKGDRLATGAPQAQGAAVPAPRSTARARALQALIDATWGYGAEEPIRVFPGREWRQFDAAAQRQLLATRYRIAAQSDRMGYRLEGPALARAAAGDILSVPIAFGTVQLPPDGQPIILMADRQSLGGYPKIVHVASVDLPRVAQRAPGEHLSFELTDLETAQQWLLARAAALQALRG